VGPVTVEQVREFLATGPGTAHGSGAGCQVVVRPVLDIAGQVPADAYETPDRLREAMRLLRPGDVFPYTSNTGRGMDLDHTEPYLSPDEGGPPGQTRIGNLGPMTRFHHRIKTHSRWRVRQPRPGVYLWRSPHGWFFQVDATGTHPLPRDAGQAYWDHTESHHAGTDHAGYDDPEHESALIMAFRRAIDIYTDGPALTT
jgi:hypothetical protein